jgi:hypothetical protein
MPVRVFAMLVCGSRMLFGGFVIPVIVVMGRLMMMVSGRVMMGGSLQMMLRRLMLFWRGHGFILQTMRSRGMRKILN